MEWIKVADRLPPRMKDVLVYWFEDDQHHIEIGWLETQPDGDHGFCCYICGEVESPEVTHWMPLPEPPK